MRGGLPAKIEGKGEGGGGVGGWGWGEDIQAKEPASQRAHVCQIAI